MSAISNPNADPRCPIPATEVASTVIDMAIDALVDASQDNWEGVDTEDVIRQVSLMVLDAILSSEGPSSESVLTASISDREDS